MSFYYKKICVLLFSLQFCLPKAEKERYEKEERPESQQEILWRAATSLPLYTRTGAGGMFNWECMSKTVCCFVFVTACLHLCVGAIWLILTSYCCVNMMQQSVTVIGVKLSSQTGVITAPHVTCKKIMFIDYKLLDFLFIKTTLFLLFLLSLTFSNYVSFLFFKIHFLFSYKFQVCAQDGPPLSLVWPTKKRYTAHMSYHIVFLLFLLLACLRV